VIKKPEWLRKNLSSEEKVLRRKTLFACGRTEEKHETSVIAGLRAEF
jgi:hypothetical protein